MKIRVRDLSEAVALCMLTVHDANDVTVEFLTEEPGAGALRVTQAVAVVEIPAEVVADLAKKADDAAKGALPDPDDDATPTPTPTPTSAVKHLGGKRKAAAACLEMEDKLTIEMREKARASANVKPFSEGKVHSQWSEDELDRYHAALALFIEQHDPAGSPDPGPDPDPDADKPATPVPELSRAELSEAVRQLERSALEAGKKINEIRKAAGVPSFSEKAVSGRWDVEKELLPYKKALEEAGAVGPDPGPDPGTGGNNEDQAPI